MSNDLQQLLLYLLVSDSRKSLSSPTSQFVGFLYLHKHLKSRCQCSRYHSRQKTTSYDVANDKMPFLLLSGLYLVYHSVSFTCLHLFLWSTFNKIWHRHRWFCLHHLLFSTWKKILNAKTSGGQQKQISFYFSPLRNLFIISLFPAHSSPKAFYLSPLKC